MGTIAPSGGFVAGKPDGQNLFWPANFTFRIRANIAAQGPVQPQGPKLDFFSLIANASIASGGNVNGFVNNTLQSIQQIATVAMYQVGGAQNANIAMALYPVAAYDTATLVAAAQTANTATIGIPTANVFARATFVTQGTYYS